MINWFVNLNHTIQALIATIFTWSITALGASLVFMFKKINKNVMDAMLGFAAGIMISASFFSLISPAIEMANTLNINSWVTISIGFLCGGLLLFVGDKLYNKFDNKLEKSNSKKRCIMLIFSITLP